MHQETPKEAMGQNWEPEVMHIQAKDYQRFLVTTWSQEKNME